MLPPLSLERQMLPHLHPACNVWDPMPDDELEKLAQDIADRGQIDPITMLDGEILDGRNRWIACELAGVEPRTIQYDGNDPVRFVISKNQLRRHTTKEQLAFAAATLANMSAGSNRFQRKVVPGNPGDYPEPVTQAEAASALGVSPSAVEEAKQVLTAGAPNLIQYTKEGKVKLTRARKAAQGHSKEEQSKWDTPDKVPRERRSKRDASPKPKGPSIAEQQAIRNQTPPFDATTLEERGMPPQEKRNEQYPGAPDGVTYMDQFREERGRAQVFSVSEEEQIKTVKVLGKIIGALRDLDDPDSLDRLNDRRKSDVLVLLSAVAIQVDKLSAWIRSNRESAA